MYVFACIYNIPQFFLSSVIDGHCVNLGISSLMTKVYSWFSFVLNAVIPFTMLIHMNYVIVKAVRKSRRMFRSDDKTTREGRGQELDARQRTMKSAQNQVTIMLLLVTTLFLILLFPTYCRYLLLVFIKRDTPLKYVNIMFLFRISALLYISNSGINFFLYCISGKKFRNDLKELLYCSDTRRKLNSSVVTGPV